MQRILEPELMERHDQAEAYARAYFEAPHSRLVELFRERFPDAPEFARVLDLGCGPGDVALRFADAYPGWTIDGVDGSPAMIAASSICRERFPKVGERVRLHLGRLPDWRPPYPPYRVILSNSLLHHLHDPLMLWGYIARWAQPGTVVFIADLRRPDSGEEARRLTDLYTQGEPAVLKEDFFHSLCAAFTPNEIREHLRAAGLARLHVETPSDRHVLVWGIR
ncbi:MAG: class I SAM-dependent methyltransferase [Kiritimatiellae bacterium]|nr:class I SAM-dependent methyltransferase [Kiritimatiellia bacterium]MDW8458145.1 class I SAM-dependent methyltransferase [Verrucomicrobiota bacterium]